MTNDEKTQNTKQMSETERKVRDMLKGTDPDKASAVEIRRELGNKGGYGTIQKVIRDLRADKAKDVAIAQAVPGAVPKAPVEVADAFGTVWLNAYTSAQNLLLGQITRITGERDAALLKLTVMETDALEMITADDEQAVMLEKALEDKETAEVKLTAAVSTLQTQLAQHVLINETMAAEFAKVKAEAAAELAKVTADAKHADELATRDAKITSQAMQSTIDHLNDQVAELKSLLIVRTTVGKA